ncbi:DUF1684 domain-containing protein [Deinococcus metallilatus]|uniref:DUF1684 domain-containing protein n=1 Tax=Deinococcus metallilatus TaxID=1211322 RepID=A0AAJ5F643_9DEIO|nr:DUF1684 domain-containing protein [Deinococcus metallilatus]MBB5295950.1 hypothetical protein [Deinococcus metallilatus]QBY08221.1 DUF1684 domain-containing protein [Deinococcus metallilatus]RXJ11952.1 DUF1684 domain-containing protein [Deinococcus metallilatus]TLK25816.1 DUF1684 domain-containing protein [Deinococcus metallilatus]GMA14515.1 hypothetical protein GCM10025871_08460 [Deinococcus metallilatus]
MSGAGYAEAVADFRRRKDEHFRAGHGPLPGEALPGFRGLSYYPPDEAWSFIVPVERADGAEVTLGTNTGEPRVMARFGTASVDLPGGPQTLTLYVPPGDEAPARVFVPFRDATSGTETYGAGRYLDAPLTWAPEGPEVRLDFNLAYHPYCAYGEGWTCPLPPRENWLTGPVRAGERSPEG